MLTIEIVTEESYDEEKEEFVPANVVVVALEHSLVSLSKWESIHEKPFLGKHQKTPQEMMSYIVCMTLTPSISADVYNKLSESNIAEIDEYINSKQTGTTFSTIGEERSREIITSEIIYYWMTAMNIDWQAQYWHLNRLLTLVRVINQKNAPKKKMNPSEIAARNRELNAQRRAALGSTG